MQSPKYIEVTMHPGTDGNAKYIVPGTLHLVLQEDEKGVWVQGISRPVLLYNDEFSIYRGPVNAEILENNKRFFEKSQQESKTSTIFVSSVNSLKIKAMKKEQTAKAQKEVTNLTKTEMQVMEAIFSNPVKGKAVKSDNENMIGVNADLDNVDSVLDGIDAAKVCRKLKRQGLLTYEWNTDEEGNRLEDKSRSVAITQEGFDLIQLGVKQPKPKAEKAPKEAKPKKEKAVKATKSKDDDDLLGEEDKPEGFSVQSNAVTKVFIIRLPEHGRFIKKATNLKEYKELQKETYDGWITRLQDGELTEQPD